MPKKYLPLEEVSIEELFDGNEQSTYEIPIYQRNYAWEKDEINALVQDVYDAYIKDATTPYYIGTLVSHHKGDRVYEIIDGQQRLTTLRLILDVIGFKPGNRLTYRARKKSDDTLKSMPNFNIDDKDTGIEYGYRYVSSAINEIVIDSELPGFIKFFRECVHIIHYQVPKDIDLNHYFEIMNSRGEQLEKHEIVKANLMQKLQDDDERKVFNRIWECCAEMSVYAQQNLGGFKPESIFGNDLCDIIPESFDEMVCIYRENKKNDAGTEGIVSLYDIIHKDDRKKWKRPSDENHKKDSFQPIIDFPNFLLIVLKIIRMSDTEFIPAGFNLDDKELLNEFRDVKMSSDSVKQFAYTLLKAKFDLDNYVVHHSKEEDTFESNPWKLQVWHKDEETKKGQLRNLTDTPLQDKLAHLLSMFEVSFTARQRKNYLFYCLFYLMNNKTNTVSEYAEFVESLADRYFYNVYMDNSKLNAINTPLPGSFDEVVLDGNKLSIAPAEKRSEDDFVSIYGDGTEASRGVPLFVFNYLDYKIWRLYNFQVRGKEYKEGSRERNDFFRILGCHDFGLQVFDQFYFSRTRRSLEHYYPQAMATGIDGFLDQNQINCLGNYAMIGSEANSSGSNWSPGTKLDHYLDISGKVSQISVASLKFLIMMQSCKDNNAWKYDEIKKHQDIMVSLLLDNSIS